MKKSFNKQQHTKPLYCPNCNLYPDKIIERYSEPIEETREWQQEFEEYALLDSNMGEIEEILRYLAKNCEGG